MRVLLLALLASAVVWAGRGPLLRWMGGHLVHEDPLAQSDAIVILSGGVPEREMAASDLFRAGWSSKVLLMAEPPSQAVALLRGRGVRVPLEIDERVRYLSELGVSPGAITVLPGVVESTFAEAEAVHRWASGAGARRLIIVTSTYHTARARFVFTRRFRRSETSIVMRGAPADAFDPAGWWRSRTMLRNGLFEWQKVVFYRVRYCCS